MLKSYDYESEREYAFIIVDKDKVYEGGLHFECFIKALMEQGYEEDELFQLDEITLENLMDDKDIICGELTREGNAIIYSDDSKDYKLVKDKLNPTNIYTYCLGYIQKVDDLFEEDEDDYYLEPMIMC